MYKKNNKGFTAIEIILALSLLSVILLAGFNMLVFGFDVFNSGSSIVEQQQSLQQIAISVTNDIRVSEDVIIGADSLTVVLDCSVTPAKQSIYTYVEDDGIIKKNGNIYAKNVTGFSVSEASGLYLVSITTKDNAPLIIKAGRR